MGRLGAPVVVGAVLAHLTAARPAVRSRAASRRSAVVVPEADAVGAAQRLHPAVGQSGAEPAGQRQHAEHRPGEVPGEYGESESKHLEIGQNVV